MVLETRAHIVQYILLCNPSRPPIRAIPQDIKGLQPCQCSLKTIQARIAELQAKELKIAPQPRLKTIVTRIKKHKRTHGDLDSTLTGDAAKVPKFSQGCASKMKSKSVPARWCDSDGHR